MQVLSLDKDYGFFLTVRQLFLTTENSEKAQRTRRQTSVSSVKKLRVLCGFSLFFTAEALRRRGKVIDAFFVLIRLIRVNSWILLTVH